MSQIQLPEDKVALIRAQLQDIAIKFDLPLRLTQVQLNNARDHLQQIQTMFATASKSGITSEMDLADDENESEHNSASEHGEEGGDEEMAGSDDGDEEDEDEDEEMASDEDDDEEEEEEEEEQTSLDGTFGIYYFNDGARASIQLNACTLTRGGYPNFWTTLDDAVKDLVNGCRHNKRMPRIVTVDWCADRNVSWDDVAGYFVGIPSIKKLILDHHMHDPVKGDEPWYIEEDDNNIQLAKEEAEEENEKDKLDQRFTFKIEVLI